MVEPALFGPIDAALAPGIGYVVLALVVVNLVTRLLAHRSHVRQAGDDDGAVSRHLGHELSNWLLVLASFYYLTLHHHAGIVLSTLVITMVVADFFEFESRRVEARNDLEVEAPKGAIAGSLLVLAYAAYVSLLPSGPVGQFLLVAPL